MWLRILWYSTHCLQLTHKFRRSSSSCYSFTCSWALARCGGLGATPGFFLVIAGELSPLRLGVRQSCGWCTELWDTTEEESSTTSASMADTQLQSELLKTLMCSPDDEVLSTEAETGTGRNNQIMFIHLDSYWAKKSTSNRPFCYQKTKQNVLSRWLLFHCSQLRWRWYWRRWRLLISFSVTASGEE